jgi:hypothetical protein
VTGLLSSEIIGWHGNAEQLWNAAEASETRNNARVARELRPALPAELPLPEQIKLVRVCASGSEIRTAWRLTQSSMPPTLERKTWVIFFGSGFKSKVFRNAV